jgi:hypothetical protein
VLVRVAGGDFLAGSVFEIVTIQGLGGAGIDRFSGRVVDGRHLWGGANRRRIRE